MNWRSVNFEMSFWRLQFSQKTNENNSTWGTKVVRSNFFVPFLGELKIPKRHFEINGPLPIYKLPKIPDILIIPCDRFKFYWEAIMRDKFAFTALSSPSDNWHNQLKPLFTRACNHKNAPRPLLSSRGVGSYIKLGGQLLMWGAQ